MSQPASHLLLIEPSRFDFNEDTAVNNVFQQRPSEAVHEKALSEFRNFTSLLQLNGLDLTIIRDETEPFSPDAVFPNNWISFHEDGSLAIYPMFAPNRRLERKQAIIDQVIRRFGIRKVHDLSDLENRGIFLEGTGSLVLERETRIAYACLSARTHPDAIAEFCKLYGYRSLVFSAETEDQVPIYHTNVMMCMADRYVVICLDSIPDNMEKNKLLDSFNDSGKKVIPITLKQLHCFAGNMLQVMNRNGERLLVMSSRAYSSLSPEQLEQLGSYNRIIHSPLDTIESAGGGSARCMLAEVYGNEK